MKRTLACLPASCLALAGLASAQTTTPARILCADSIVDRSGAGCLTASSTPTLGRLFPLSNDFYIDAATGYVGMGTTFPSSKLAVVELGGAPFSAVMRVDTDAQVGVAILAQNYDQGNALRGNSGGDLAAAVVGNTSTSGAGIGYIFGTGVTGITSVDPPFGNDTAGVFGRADRTANDDNGVWGESRSEGAGSGVYGQHSSTLGTGAGVEGWTSASASNAAGVRGVVESTGPGGFSAGVRGENRGTQGNGIGVWGSQDGFGWGVYGTAGPGGIGVNGSAGTTGIGVFGSGSSFGVFSSGDFGGNGAKYFVQPHPTDAGREIRYVCLEGDESGTYFRGSGELAGGRARIEVPESFRLVTDAEGLTVQVTARGPGSLWVESVSLNTIVVRGERDVAFDYFVNGVRRGFTNHEPIHENVCFRPRFRGEPFGTELRSEVRAMLVESGVLNADFTPNEATARRLGWELVDRPQAQALHRAAPRAAEHSDRVASNSE